MHGLVRHPPEEELAQAKVAGHAAHHYLTDRRSAAAREPGPELLVHERSAGATAVRPPRAPHAAAVPAACVAIALSVPLRGGRQAVIIAAALVHRPPAVSRGTARHRMAEIARVAPRRQGEPCSGRLEPKGYGHTRTHSKNPESPGEPGPGLMNVIDF